jgi:methylmalonyl-CoA mutase N-terminal domain/subunit
LPSEKAVKIALRTQQIIAEESGVTNTVDPLGGSYFVEALTDEMERQCLDYFRRIEEQGGMEAALEKGWIQREIAEASYAFQREVDDGQRGIVGVNKHVEREGIEIPILDAVRAYATVGEICDVMREVFGVYREVAVV